MRHCGRGVRGFAKGALKMESGTSDKRVFEIDACVVKGCAAKVRPGHLMCDEHFAMLSREQQQQFYRARFKYEQRAEGGDQLLHAVMATCAESVEQGSEK
jgi:hypothetical protein